MDIPPIEIIERFKYTHELKSVKHYQAVEKRITYWFVQEPYNKYYPNENKKILNHVFPHRPKGDKVHWEMGDD